MNFIYWFVGLFVRPHKRTFPYPPPKTIRVVADETLNTGDCVYLSKNGVARKVRGYSILESFVRAMGFHLHVKRLAQFREIAPLGIVIEGDGDTTTVVMQGIVSFRM